MQTGKTNSFVFCHLSFVLFLFSFIFYLSSCQRSTAPVYSPQKLQLTVVDVSCTEAWLRLKTEGTEKAENENDWVLQVFRDDSLVVNKDWGAGDSLIYLDGLQPATAYAFSAKLLRDNKLLFSSPKVTATTMDTTSHDFTWQTFEFGGQGGSSSFYDVAIIDENDIWAVGEIYTADDKYNAAHWDGEKWELKKIYFYLCPNSNYPTAYPIKSVFAFGKNDIWFARGGSLNHWNGTNFIHDCSVNKILTGSINKIWGTSDNDLYIVGNDGMIAHYDGRQWRRIDSGTDIKLLDIWGSIDGKTVWGCGWEEFKETVLLKVEAYKAEIVFSQSTDKSYEIHSNYLSGVLTSIWSNNPYYFFTVSFAGIYKAFFSTKGEATRVGIDKEYLPGFPNRIRGADYNQIFVVGNHNFVTHFNGKSWHYYSELNGNIVFKSVDVQKDLVVAVGTDPISWRAFILFGNKKN